MNTAGPTSSGDDDSPDYVDRILKGSGSVFSGSMVEKAIAFGLNIVLTRGLGPALYGLYNVALTILRLIQGTASLGLQNGIVRFAAPPYERNEPAKVKGTFLAGGALGLAMGLLSGLVLYLTAPWLAHTVFDKPELVRVIEIFALGLPAYVFTFLASRMARAVGQVQVDVLLSSIIQPAIFLVLVSGVFLLELGFTAALYAFLISTLLAAGTSVYAVYRLFPAIFSSLSPQYRIRNLLRFSLPIIGVNLASAGLSYTDRLMLGALASSSAVGIYTAAASFAVQLRFVLSAINTPFSPLIADLYQNGKTETLESLYVDTVRWIIIFTLPAVLGFVIFAPQIMSIYGTDFRAGAPLLRILAVAYLVVTGVGSVGHMLQMSDHQDFVLGVNIFMALLNLGLNWILIQWYGAMGAAVATGVTQALGNTIQIIAVYAFIGIQPFRTALWKPCAATVVAAALTTSAYLLLPAPFHWLVGIPTLSFAYGGTLLLLGLHPRDRSIADALWTKLKQRLTT